MGVTRKQLAVALAVAGAALAVAGVALIYVPAALILAGLALGGFGLLAFDVDGKKPKR